MEYSQKIKVDIRDHQTYEELYTKECDKGYPLIFEITKDKEPFQLTGITAEFRMTKPDGNVILEYGTVSGNTVQVTLTEQMTAVSGKCHFEIALCQAEQRITTISGIMKVDKTVLNNGLVSDSALNLIIESVELARGYAEDALESANNAADSAENSASSAILSRSWAVGDTNSRTGEATNNSKYYSEQSASSATSASNSATIATTKASEALSSANNASASASTATTQASNAASSAEQARVYAENSLASANDAEIYKNLSETYKNNASTYADTSRNYAVGDTNSSLYYYNQILAISERLGSALIPKGTITFAELPTTNINTGDMYNISDSFVTTNIFKEGAGHDIDPGANVYYTADNMWDILAGTPVTGVKGDNEVTYRRGNVNVTKDNIGLGNVANKYSQAEIISVTEPTNQEVGDFWMQPYDNEENIGGDN